MTARQAPTAAPIDRREPVGTPPSGSRMLAEAPPLELGAEAQQRRAPEAREVPAGMINELPRADRDGLRGHRRGGHGPLPVVRPLPRQAEGRHFMLRIKVPGGILTPAQLRAIGELSHKFGRDYGELSTRQTIQLHWLELARLPEVFATLDAVGLTTPAAAATPSATSPAARSPGSTRRAVRLHARTRRDRPRSSTATPTTSTCRASTRSRSRPAPTSATRPRSTASRSSARAATASARLRGARRRRPLVHAAHRARPRRLRADGRGAGGAARRSSTSGGRPAVPHLAGQGAPEVHGRRLRRRGHARARSRSSSATRCEDLALAAARGRATPTTSASTAQQAAGLVYIGVPGLLGQSPATQTIAHRRPGRASSAATSA